jgi:hypothetical protein
LLEATYLLQFFRKLLDLRKEQQLWPPGLHPLHAARDRNVLEPETSPVDIAARPCAGLHGDQAAVGPRATGALLHHYGVGCP